MIIAGFTATNGKKVGIPVNKITGFCEAHGAVEGKTYIATGEEGEETYNGWYVKESYREVWATLEATKAL